MNVTREEVDAMPFSEDASIPPRIRQAGLRVSGT